jgi:hypothetical protein
MGVHVDVAGSDAVQRLPLTADGIADLVAETLVQRVGGWSMGVQGALAEFAVPGALAAVAVRRSGRTVAAIAPDGGLRLGITDETRAFAVADRHRPDGIGAVYLAVPRRSLPAPSAGVTIVEGDPAALRPEDGDDLLVDLAVGHAAAAFCVRTGDAELGKRLRAVEGAPWREALDHVGHAIVAASPHRVVTTPLGRIEVYAPIPRERGASPEGPHTHLLPALLETGRELPDGVDLPPGLAPAAAFHPPPGWAPPAA